MHDQGYWTKDHGALGRTSAELDHKGYLMEFVLWIIAAILVISGIVSIIRGGLTWGIVLIVVGLLVGPGGVSIFT